MKRRTGKSNISALIAGMAAVAASEGLLPMPNPPDRRHRDSNRMELTEEELANLENLQGRSKKSYVKFLRNKYSRG